MTKAKLISDTPTSSDWNKAWGVWNLFGEETRDNQQGVAGDSLKRADAPDDLPAAGDEKPRDARLVIRDRHKGNKSPLKQR